ncbi:MAG: DUF2089 domain-containing protein [Candidatus Cloacimonetes bacterium]|nr:DUF2089 domain-containing protein [Candidatus Cloacimonadota bacterium]
MNDRLQYCPVCNGNLEIIEYHCPVCDTSIKGKFMVGGLASLTAAQQEFVRIFICAQGNIREVEKIMGISYPTVKNRLTEIARILCPSPDKGRISLEILEKIEQGKISVEEALQNLKEDN